MHRCLASPASARSAALMDFRAGSERFIKSAEHTWAGL